MSRRDLARRALPRAAVSAIVAMLGVVSVGSARAVAAPSPPELVSVTNSSTLNATTIASAAAGATVTVHLLIPHATPADGYLVYALDGPYDDIETPLLLQKGTPANGVWTGQLTAVPGHIYSFTFGLRATASRVNAPFGEWSPSQVAAAGGVPITTTVSAPPAAPTNITSGIGVIDIVGDVFTRAYFEWSNPAAEPAVVGSVLDSATGSGCPGMMSASYDADTGIEPLTYAFGLCSITFHLYNDAGNSPEASATALF